MTRRAPVVILRDGAAIKPTVFLERTASGAFVFGVKHSGRSVTRTREVVQAEFTKLLAFVKATERGKP